jgi:RNA polymerase sigma-70 factor (ECF subfamily)
MQADALSWQRVAKETCLGVEDSGGLSAYQELYELHGARLKSVALNLLGNVHDAEDAVQEVFLRVHRSMGSFRGQAALSTWAYRILINYCRDTWRRKRYRQRFGDDTMPVLRDDQDPPDPPAPVTDQPLRLALESCVAKLNRKHQEVFLLFEVEGFTHSEIAEIMKITEPSSKNILYEAKQHLRRQLEQRSKA